MRFAKIANQRIYDMRTKTLKSALALAIQRQGTTRSPRTLRRLDRMRKHLALHLYAQRSRERGHTHPCIYTLFD
jgi:hypothetical protein